MSRIWGILAVSLALAGCVRTNAQMLDSRTALVEGTGSGFESMGGVMVATLQAAAKITLQHGFDYFQIQSSQNMTRTNTMIIPGQSYTTTNVTAYGNSAYGTSTTTSAPATAVPIVIPAGMLQVKMFKQGEIDPRASGVWNAADVLAHAPDP